MFDGERRGRSAVKHANIDKPRLSEFEELELSFVRVGLIIDISLSLLECHTYTFFDRTTVYRLPRLPNARDKKWPASLDLSPKGMTHRTATYSSTSFGTFNSFTNLYDPSVISNSTSGAPTINPFFSTSLLGKMSGRLPS